MEMNPPLGPFLGWILDGPDMPALAQVKRYTRNVEEHPPTGRKHYGARLFYSRVPPVPLHAQRRLAAEREVEAVIDELAEK